MIIYGSKWFKKTIAKQGNYQCKNCNNVTSFLLIKATAWFTLFFIPIFPFKTSYYFSCPICDNSAMLKKDYFYELVEKANLGE